MNDALAGCAEALFVLCDTPPFDGRHRQALLEQTPLCGRLARLLLPAFAATAVGLQLPPERRPPEYCWTRATRMAYATLCLLTDSQTPQSGDVLRLLQAADRLAALAPADETLLMMMDHLYGGAAMCRRLVLPRGDLAPQQAAQLARQLLSTLPRYEPALQASQAQPEAAAVAHWQRTVCVSMQMVSELLAAIRSSQPATAFTPEDVQAWCMGATAALRLLVPLAALSHDGAGQPSDAALAEAAAATSTAACQLAAAASRLATVSRPASAVGSSDAAKAAAFEAAWQLHSTLCRAVHARAGTIGVLVDAASGILHGAQTHVHRSAEAAAPMAAMSAAHFELLRALLLGGSSAAAAYEPLPFAIVSLGAAVRHGPAALAAHPDAETMFSRLAAGLSQARVCS